MKLTKSQLKCLIKEELEAMLSEDKSEWEKKKTNPIIIDPSRRTEPRHILDPETGEEIGGKRVVGAGAQGNEARAGKEGPATNTASNRATRAPLKLGEPSPTSLAQRAHLSYRDVGDAYKEKEQMTIDAYNNMVAPFYGQAAAHGEDPEGQLTGPELYYYMYELPALDQAYTLSAIYDRMYDRRLEDEWDDSRTTNLHLPDEEE